jgi:peroxiredoxin
MYRWIFATLVVGAGLLTWQALRARDAQGQKADQTEKAGKADPGNSGTKQDPAKAFASLMKDLDEAIDKTESQKEVEQVRKDYGKKLYDHARAHPGDRTAVEALLLSIRMHKPGTDGVRKDAVAMLHKDFVKSPHLTKTLFKDLNSSFFDLEIGKFLQGVVKDHPDKTIRALAAKALIKARERGIEFVAEVNKKAELKKALEGDLGKAVIKELLDSEADFKKQKTDYLAKLRGELKGVIVDVMPGADAPTATATDLKGNKASLAGYKGKVVVLDFWGTFCPPCIKMIPDNRKLVKAMKDRPFAFVSVSADEEKSALTDFLKTHEMPWDHWWVGSQSKFQEAWDVEGFPTVFVIDHKGVIRYSQLGYDPENKLEKEVEKLVKEAEADKKAGR